MEADQLVKMWWNVSTLFSMQPWSSPGSTCAIPISTPISPHPNTPDLHREEREGGMGEIRT
eukprot:2248824-Rhodomonas_salina.1